MMLTERQLVKRQKELESELRRLFTLLRKTELLEDIEIKIASGQGFMCTQKELSLTEEGLVETEVDTDPDFYNRRERKLTKRDLSRIAREYRKILKPEKIRSICRRLSL